MRRMRVLVCGSNYGQSYITAIRHAPRKYELAGILARGSARSQRVAAVNGVPLYISADEIPDNIDLACAAMSSSAWPLVMKLVRRGIHVLCEHPCPAAPLKQALALASKHNLQFHVNGHFVNLPAPRAFVRECHRARKTTSPEFIEVMATERSLYGALDILASALGKPRSPRVQVLSRGAGFVLLEGSKGRLPVRLTVQVSGKKGTGRWADGSPAYLVDMRLTMAFPSGLLTLLSVAGPVVWTSTPAQTLGNREPLSTISHHRKQTLADLGEQRIQANVEALNSIRNAILGHGSPETQQPGHFLQVSKAWEHIGRQLYSD